MTGPLGGTRGDGLIVGRAARSFARLSDPPSAWHAGVMADPIVSTPRLEAAMERIRPVAFALPGVVERLSHDSPTFFTAEGRKGRTFASVHDEREWHEGRLCLWAAGPEELQEALISGAPERFFVPPYVGHRGWVGLRLDLPGVDWDEVAGVIEDAHAYVLDR